MKRALILAAPAVLALGLVACGDDDDDSPDTTVSATVVTTEEPSTTDDTLVPGGTVLPGGTLPDISLPDISIPDISIPDISLPDFSIPDISLPEDASDLLASILSQTFPNLDDDQLSCLAEAFTGEIDLNEVQSVAEDCGIDESDLRPG